MPEDIDDRLGTVIDHHDHLFALEAEAAAAADSDDSSSEDEETLLRARSILDTLTPEEKAAAQKAAILRQYAYVDTDSEDLSPSLSGLTIGRDPNAPPPKASTKGEEKAAEDRRKAIEEALRLDGKKKKHKKNLEGGLYFSSYGFPVSCWPSLSLGVW